MEGFDKAGDLKRLNWTTGHTTCRRCGTSKAEGRSSLPVLSYVARVWPKSSICPTSPRLRRVFSLSSALMPEELYVQAGAEAKAFSFADIDKPWGSRGESFTIDAFGHEKDPI